MQLTAANDQNSNGDRHHSNNEARLPRRLYFSKESSRGKEPPADAILGRMHATGFFRGYRLLYDDLRVAQLNNRNDFPPCFLYRKVIPCFLVHLPHALSQTKSLCVTEHQSVCVLLLVPIILLGNEYKLCQCARTTTLEAGDAATRNAAVWLFLVQ